MPLTDVEITTTISVPDVNGGWYWLKRNEEWEPMFVEPATKEWPATVPQLDNKPVYELPSGYKWGPQIHEPKG